MTETTQSHPLAAARLLGAGDADRLAAMLHNVIAELADLNHRLAVLEARADGRVAPGDLAALQADAAALIGRLADGT